MIIIAQIVGMTLTDLAVDEQTYESRTSNAFTIFQYDGADWNNITPGQSGVVTPADWGVSYTGTPVANDEIAIAWQPMQDLWEFNSGDGINQKKLNENFAELMQKSNTNETNINDLSTTALLADGSNITQTMIDAFNRQTPNIISGDGDIALQDNSSNFLTLTGNNSNKIVLPVIGPDPYSHTINLVVQGSAYSLDINTATGGHHLYNGIYYGDIDSTQTYNILFIYNKIDGFWYYSVTQ